MHGDQGFGKSKVYKSLNFFLHQGESVFLENQESYTMELFYRQFEYIHHIL